MRNLSLVGERRRKVNLKDVAASDKNNRRVVDMCEVEGDGIDFQSGSTSSATRFILTNDGIVAKLADNSLAGDDDGNEMLWVAHLDPLCEQRDGEWFQLTQVDTGEELVLCCLSRNGAMVTVNPQSGEAELVGEFEHGLQAASFSPDAEVLCLLTFSEPDEDDDDGNQEHQVTANNEQTKPTKKSVLLLMNTQWEVLAETKVENHVPMDGGSNAADSAASMCWRPDGSLVALSTVDVADNTRKIRIFKRDDLQFHAIGRTEDGSGKLVPNIIASAGISWADAGCSQLLAAAQRKGKKTTQVIFFEPNGNRHREFVLHEQPSTEVLGLAWNVSSDLLAVTLREEGICDKVQLWHRSNYHWYMKQEFRYASKVVARVAFHAEKSSVFFVFFHDELEWREFEILWQPSNIQLLSSKTCAAYVIDGSSLNATALDQAMVPPPMYASTLSLDCPICQVVLSNDDTKSVTAIVVLSNASFALLGNPVQSTGGRGRFGTPQIVAKGSLKDLQGLDCTALRSFVIVEQADDQIQLLSVACAETNESSEKLVVLTLTWNEADQTALVSHSSNSLISVDGRVLYVAPWSDSFAGALFELEDGKLFEFVTTGDGGGMVHPLSNQELMEPCSVIAGLKNAASLTVSEQPDPDGHNESFHEPNRLVLGLSSRSRLFCEDVLLADAVSSFFVSVSHQYLCYVAAQGATSQLRFLPLRDLHHFDALMGSDGNVLLEGYAPRSVERGSRLVAVFPGSPTAVLQVPRGNLEGICPRALVLRFAMKKISTGEYGGAFSMMRRHKVNLNLIVDLNPRRFLDSGITPLLKQVTVIGHLNLFISCLQNWDSTNVQYRIPPWLNLVPSDDAATKKVFDFSSKVNLVCEKLRLAMILAEKNARLEDGKDITEGHFLLPILTTFAKEDPPKLEEALTLIKENAVAKSKLSTAASKKPPMFSDAAQSSIQYLAFLADHELLFNVGLGLYDFDIARACARNSQMDPKVYLPLLKRLRSLPTYYGRYEVDMKVKRYEQALRNLFESGQANESLDGIEPVQLDDTASTPAALGNSFENCLPLIENHRLYAAGLELFKHDKDKKRWIMLSLGDSLMKDGKPESALTLFLSAEPADIRQAKAAARACRNWKCFFTLSFQNNLEDREREENDRLSMARELAEGIALNSDNQYNRQSDFGDAARILLDYSNDIEGAVDMLIRGWSWQEACRIATLQCRPDLFQKCVDAAVLFAESAQSDLEERKETFLTTNKRYEEVLEIRKEAIRNGEQDDNFVDEETGSLFSAASNASNLSLQSTASVDSLSSYISIKSASTFTLTGREQDTRHKSKFNQQGGKQKKKKSKKKKQGKNRVRIGSVEELQNLVTTLRSTCGDKEYCRVVADTIEFLSQTGRMLDVARVLFKTYVDTSESIQKCQVGRLEAQKAAYPAENHNIPVTLAVEEEVDKLSCPKLPDSLHAVFSIFF